MSAGFARIRAAFERAIELPEAERDAFLDAELGSDTPDRGEVERLLRAEPRGRDYLEPPGDATLAAAAPVLQALPTGHRVGPFELVRLIGIGGMGTVYEARQEMPNRTVALKLMRPGLGSERSMRRFRDEVETLARLQHPGIAQVFDAGIASGDVPGTQVPWFAMELLEGARTLTDHARDAELDLRPRIDLFLQVCDAVHHAHQRGVIHCDLKPANILVAQSDRAKVIDFGVAQSIASETLAERTRTAEIAGTLLYMSPEQLSGKGSDADVRTDVYALGVVLFELLCDRVPFDLGGKSLTEACRAVAEQEPPRPSSSTSLPDELDWIVGLAMRKEREARYASVHELAADLHRLLNHEPVLAGPPSTGYRLRKFTRRHRVGVTAAALVMVAFVATFVAVTDALVRTQHAEAEARQERERAVAQAHRAEVSLAFLEDVFSSVNPGRDGRLVPMADALDRAARDFDERFADEPEVRAALAKTVGVAYEGLGQLAEASKHLQTSVTVRELHYGDSHRQTAESLVELAHVRARLGELSAATELLDRAQTGLVGAAPFDSLAIGWALRRGELLIEQGKFVDAVELLRPVVERPIDTDSKPSLEILAKNLLAVALQRLGRLPEAESLYRDAEAALLDSKGEDHPETLAVANNLGTVQFFLARTPEQREAASAKIKRVLELRRTVLGNQHKDTIGSISNLGFVMYAVQRVDEAVALFDEGIALVREHDVKDFSTYVTMLSNLGMIERNVRRDYTRAEEFLREAYEVRVEKLPKGHDRTLVSLMVLAELYGLRDEYERALALFAEGIVLAREHHPAGSRTLYGCLRGSGQTLIALQQYGAAETALLECVAIYEDVVSNAMMKNRITRVEPDLVRLYEAWGKPEEAARYREIVQAVEATKRGDGR